MQEIISSLDDKKTYTAFELKLRLGSVAIQENKALFQHLAMPATGKTIKNHWNHFRVQPTGNQEEAQAEKVKFTFRLSESQYQRLSELASSCGCSKSQWLRLAYQQNLPPQIPLINNQIDDLLQHLLSNLTQISGHGQATVLCHHLSQLATGVRSKMTEKNGDATWPQPQTSQPNTRQFTLAIPRAWKTKHQNLSSMLRNLIINAQLPSAKPFPASLANPLDRHLRLINTYAHRLNSDRSPQLNFFHFERTTKILNQYLGISK